MDRASLPLRLTVFENENPDLFHTLSSLPVGRIARRTALIRLLELGVRAARGEIARPEVAATLSDAGGYRASVANATGGAIAGAIASAEAATDVGLPDVQIDQSDLAEVFG